MRKIIESTLVSLDGAVSDPHLWAAEYFDAEAERCALELLATSDAMLMGRRTYEFLAAAFPRRKGDYGDRVNGLRKYVFSSTLHEAAWGNSTLVKGDVAAETRRLKQQSGKDLVIYGHGLLAETLLRQDLIDEIKIWIHPVIVGRGRPLFREGEAHKLELIEQQTLETGVVLLTYRAT